jgi:membrane protein
MEVAAGVTYYVLLSLFPAITVFVSAYGLFAEGPTIVKHLQVLASFLPAEVLSIVSDQVERITAQGDKRLSLALIIGLMIAVWSSNAGTKSIIASLNIAYDVEETRSFFGLNMRSLAITLAGLLVLILMVAGVAILPVVLDYLSLGWTTELLVSLGRWPVIVGVVLLALAVLYRFGPDKPGVRWRWITPGSALASVGFLIFSLLFSWYAANFADYNKTYGSLGAAIAFTTWSWLSVAIIIMGVELDNEIERQEKAKPDES